MNYVITGKGYVSELVKQADPSVKILTEDEFRNSKLTLKAGDKIYAPTESTLEIILDRSEDPEFTKAVNLLKDKHKFRELMSSIYPDFYFRKVMLDELEIIKIDRKKKFIVKPTKGFFGTAVKELKTETDIAEITKEIRSELIENTRYFSESVLSKNELIVEQFIEGEEYAVDMYFNKDGEPEILNIYHHPLPEKNDYFHVLYYTNKFIFDKFYEKLKSIFIELNKHLNVTSFPIHAEFKLENEKLIPIEMNPLRYGGFGLADLTFHAFGFNPFLAYFNNFKPNWNEIWQTGSEYNFGWVLGYNGTNIELEKQKPEHDKFRNYLGDVLHYVKIDHTENPVFAIAYFKDSNPDSLQRILETEFNDFFIPEKK